MEYVIRRVLATVPVMLVVSVIVFLLIHLAPGDPVLLIVGDFATPEQIAQTRAALGLDQPLWHQFVVWVGNVVRGDFGVSLFNQMPVSQLLGQRIGATLSIAFFTILVAVLLSIPLGVLAAYRAGSWIDRLVMVFAVCAFSMPVFLTGYLLVYTFALKLQWLPVQGYRGIAEGVLPWLKHLVLPATVLGLLNSALIIRFTRASMLDVLGEDYVRTARSKGLSETVVVLKHALRNALVPIVTVIGLTVALMIGGAVITETVFGLPGVGNLVVSAVLRRDYPVIQGTLLVIAAIYVLINFSIDLLYAVVDPRVKV
jgi:peptide/nickel transport system permease protein